MLTEKLLFVCMHLGTIQGAEEAEEDCQDGMVADVSAAPSGTVFIFGVQEKHSYVVVDVSWRALYQPS